MQPLWKLLPLIVNVCALPVATGENGFTLVIVAAVSSRAVFLQRLASAGDGSRDPESLAIVMAISLDGAFQAR